MQDHSRGAETMDEETLAREADEFVARVITLRWLLTQAGIK